MLFIGRRLRHLVVASVALTLAALPGSAGAIASPAVQPPTPQAALPILLTDPVPDPHQPGVQWFAPTGHTLRGPFLDYWNRYGGLPQFGYPITEEFTEPVGPDNRPVGVQYFERYRFEHHPENAGTPYEVLLGTLGLDFHSAEQPVSPLPAPARYFEQTGHNLSGALKAYWETHGGLFVHGFPITEQFEEVNPIDHKKYAVQYFERSRFELHSEYAGSQYEVLLGLLGTQLAQKKGYPYGWYPLYGYAADYSWFAGYYKADPRKCAPCGCATVQFVNPSNTAYQGVEEVWPYFPDQPLRMQLDVEGLVPSDNPQTFIVVFGQLDDPHSIGTSKPAASCLSPKFKVTDLERNPAH